MRKKYIIVLLLIMFISIGLVVFIFLEKVDYSKISRGQNISIEQELNINKESYENKIIEDTDPYVIFDVKYPYFKNVDNSFNLSIEKLLKDKIEESKKISKENWQARYDTQVEGDNISKVPPEDEKFSFYSDFKVIQSNSDYISCVLTYGGFTGGAHGYEDNVSFNYNVKDKKNIELKDLFPNNPKYLEYISEKSRESLQKTFATVSEDDKKYATEKELKVIVDDILASIESGTEPKEENFSIFTFTKDKVKIYFAQYQVGPYTLGSPEVDIYIK